VVEFLKITSFHLIHMAQQRAEAPIKTPFWNCEGKLLLLLPVGYITMLFIALLFTYPYAFTLLALNILLLVTWVVELVLTIPDAFIGCTCWKKWLSLAKWIRDSGGIVGSRQRSLGDIVSLNHSRSIYGWR
jgi:hypothetical protein